MTSRPGRVRSARLTDLAALGELSRLAHRPHAEIHDDGRAAGSPEEHERPIRSLGLPVTVSHVSVFSLFRLPLGAFQPNDQLYVYDEDGRLAGLTRVERDPQRDEWTIVELDAVDHGDAGDIRYRLVQHLLRDGSRRGAVRFHVACADSGGNVELFMQAGFARYGEELVLVRDPHVALPRLRSLDPGALGIRPVSPQDALGLARLYERVTPAPVARLESYRLSDWEHLTGRSRVPRTALTPLLRLADVEAYVQERQDGGPGDLGALLQLGVAKEQQPHYLRVMSLPGHDPAELVRFGLAIISKRTRGERAGREHDHGVMSCVRTYESPIDRRLEEQGFRTVARVSLLLKEALVRVAEPSLVPVTR
jgi:hypothetical protein